MTLLVLWTYVQVILNIMSMHHRVFLANSLNLTCSTYGKTT